MKHSCLFLCQFPLIRILFNFFNLSLDNCILFGQFYVVTMETIRSNKLDSHQKDSDVAERTIIKIIRFANH